MKHKMYWEASVSHEGEDSPMQEWKSVYDENIRYLRPNKKNSRDVLEYVKGRYPTEDEPLERIRMVVEMNALGHRPYLPEGIFDRHPPQIVVLNIKNEGAGRELYNRQSEDFWELAEEQRRMVADIEYIPEDDFPVPIFIGVEMNSGYVYVEGSPRLADEVFVFQGLNEKELENVYLVARYVKLLKRNAETGLK